MEVMMVEQAQMVAGQQMVALYMLMMVQLKVFHNQAFLFHYQMIRKLVVSNLCYQILLIFYLT